MASIGWDRGQIYSTAVLPGAERVNTHAELTAMFQEFIQNFRIDNNFVYRQAASRIVLPFVTVLIENCLEINYEIT